MVIDQRERIGQADIMGKVLREVIADVEGLL